MLASLVLRKLPVRLKEVTVAEKDDWKDASITKYEIVFRSDFSGKFPHEDKKKWLKMGNDCVLFIDRLISCCLLSLKHAKSMYSNC